MIKLQQSVCTSITRRFIKHSCIYLAAAADTSQTTTVSNISRILNDDIGIYSMKKLREDQMQTIIKLHDREIKFNEREIERHLSLIKEHREHMRKIQVILNRIENKIVEERSKV